MDMFICAHSELSNEELEKRKYVFPEERKFPLPDKAHVLSAIKFFNYVEPSKEKILASAILKRMKEYGMTNVNVGKDNRFSKYYHPKETIQHEGITMEKFLVISEEDYIAHHGIKGQRWGVRRYQNSDGTLTAAGRQRYGLSEDRYTKSQQIQDKRLYGKKAVKRVAKKLGQGENLKSARHVEAKNEFNRKVMKKVTAKAITTGAIAAGTSLTLQYMANGGNISPQGLTKAGLTGATTVGLMLGWGAATSLPRNPYR